MLSDFNWGVSNARYAYFILMLIDGEWQRISFHYHSFKEAYQATLHFAGERLVICYTISLKNI